MTTLTLENIGSFIEHQGPDALVLSRFFKQVNFSEEQAEAIAEVLSRSSLANEKLFEKKIENLEEKNLKNLTELTTKGDLLQTTKELELKIELETANLEIKLEKVKSDLIKWVVGLMLAQAGLLFALLKFFTNF